MFNVGTPELLVILLVALIFLGPDKLPAAARKVGHLTHEIRRMSSGFQEELRDAMQEPVMAASATDDRPTAVEPTTAASVERGRAEPGRSPVAADAPTPPGAGPGPSAASPSS